VNFIDIHCHLLAGIDDGPEEIETSLAMLERAKEDGIAHLFCTPHIMDGVYNNRRDGIIAAVESLRDRAPAGLSLYHGADVRVVPDLPRRVEEGSVPTLGDSGYLLLELPEYSVPPHLDQLFHNLRYRGVTSIITHPERHSMLMGDLKLLRQWHDEGILVQVTAMSITGRFGKGIAKSARAMLKAGIVDFIATDAHAAHGRSPILSRAFDEVSDEFGAEAAELIFFDNPQKIVDSIGSYQLGQRR